MKTIQRIRTTAASLALSGMLIPSAAFAEPGPAVVPAAKTFTASEIAIHDVALHSGGTLVGQVVDRSGAPVVGTDVVVLQASREVGRAQTGASGEYRVSGLRGGVYQVSTTEGVGNYRLWSEGTAPPAAAPGALIVNDEELMARGQCGRVLCALANPWVVGAAVAAAIAIPLALSNNDSGS